jgi:hypothetical protein
MTILNNPTPYTFEQWSAHANDLVAVINGGDGSDLHPFYKQFIWDRTNFGTGSYGSNFILIDNESRIFMNRWPDENGQYIPVNNINTFNEMLDFIYVYGCTDSTALNYDEDATIDDGSCIPIILGCTDPNAFNYNSNANTDSGDCVYDTDGDGTPDEEEIFGCTDPAALNYDSMATEENGSCYYVSGCTDPNADNYNPDADQNDGSCTYYSGCTDPNAENYDPEAQTDDGSCYYLDDVLGCMNEAAENYNPDATLDDGSCIFADMFIQGCVDYRAINWNKYALIDDNSCEYIIEGDATGEYGGCSDPLAVNYNQFASNPCFINDGQGRPVNFCCVYKMPNRQYPNAQVRVNDDGKSANMFGYNSVQVTEQLIGGGNGAWLYCESYWLEQYLAYYWGPQKDDTPICGSDNCITGDIACNYFYEDYCNGQCIGKLVPKCSDALNTRIFNCFLYDLNGDMNFDGIINVLDLVLWISRFESALGISETLYYQYPEMDINGDGIINVLDLVVLLNMVLDAMGMTEDRNQIVRLLDDFMIKNNLSSVHRGQVLKAKKTLIEEIEKSPKSLPMDSSMDIKQSLINEILRNQKNE